jgi:hypothetical protein
VRKTEKWKREDEENVNRRKRYKMEGQWKWKIEIYHGEKKQKGCMTGKY